MRLAKQLTAFTICSAFFGCSANGASSLTDKKLDSGSLLDTGEDSGFIEAPTCDISTTSTVDSDHDGYSPSEGDCNDCTAQMNPGAYDFVGNGIDEDCNGKPDDEPLSCDYNLAEDSVDPMAAANSLGICRKSDANAQGKDRTWGVISARWVFPDGSTESAVPKSAGNICTGQGGQGSPPNSKSHGILAKFGSAVSPRAGSSILALSSGVARAGINGDSPMQAQMCTKSGTPAGFPTPSSAACPGQKIIDSKVAHDGMALELTIRTPTNAKSLSFDFNFYTTEFPGWVCQNYNDFFVALLDSQAPGTPTNQNISFDAAKNPVSVNNGLLEACQPQAAGGKNFACKLGINQLAGTGFEGHAATGWLQTSAPIVPGEDVTLRFAIWDAVDEIWDSTVLIDNFRWDISPGEEATTVRPPS